MVGANQDLSAPGAAGVGNHVQTQGAESQPNAAISSQTLTLRGPMFGNLSYVIFNTLPVQPGLTFQRSLLFPAWKFP